MWLRRKAGEDPRIIVANAGRAARSPFTSQKENQSKDFFDLTRVIPQVTLPVCQCAVLWALGCSRHFIFRFHKGDPSNPMTKYKLEYIWLDGRKPVPELRGKTTIKAFDRSPALADLPLWGFDGSSTMQAEGKSSDCVLKPVALYPDASRKDAYIVLSEVMHADGSPHPTNARATIENDPDLWIGFEQEYFLYQDGRPLGFPKEGHPSTPQGPYYCGVGYKYMGNVARKIVDEHLELCHAAGINHEGINAEVAKGQWEFQIFAKGSAKAADDTWTARYLMMRLCEKYEVDVVLYCKPIKGDWNGSGMHTNFSTKYMREVGGKEYFEALMKAFYDNIAAHIAVYGPDNHLRLTGLHETQAIDKFSYGLSDRGASIRMPINFIKDGYKGYLEDRRPNSEGDPYQIVSRILKTINSVPKPIASKAMA
jgi:glutamine synthetase